MLRAPHRWLARLRGHRVGALALVGVLGPGLLAGLSDDDPAGITTYSILGADYGYCLLWVLALSTAALIVFHELAARTGVVTGKGLMRLVRERYGHRAGYGALAALVIANVGTICAEFAGVAAACRSFGNEPLRHRAARRSRRQRARPARQLPARRARPPRPRRHLRHLHRLLAHPDWSAAGRGLVIPSLPGTRQGVLDTVATVGTTLAPWGLAFMQSYAVDKQLAVKDLRYERVDVISGAILTGVIGLFVIVACAATLHSYDQHIRDASDAAVALRPLAGNAAHTLFGLGLVGAALLAAAVVPLSTAYSVAETFDQRADLNDRFADAKLFYVAYDASTLLAVTLVLIPGAPLVSILFLTQALNAVLLLAILPFLRALARDPTVMGEHRLGRGDAFATAAVIALVAVSITALAVLTAAGYW